MIHQYKNNGYNIVMDVNSGSVHVVDDIVYDMIPLVEPLVNEGIKDADTIKAAVLNLANIPYPDEEIMEAVKAAQALDVVEKKGGLDGEIEQNGRNLSGGQRQRLSIARALVGNPEIIILDDSSSALDFATDAALRKSLKELKGEPTVFIVSQRTSSIQHADLILVLEDGDLVGKGMHEELLNSCEVYQEIYMSQYKKEE